jgi:hypothetical protein
MLTLSQQLHSQPKARDPKEKQRGPRATYSREAEQMTRNLRNRPSQFTINFPKAQTRD